MKKADLVRIGENIWEVPQSYRGDMRVPARVYTSERMLDSVVSDRSLEQLVNVTTLPGIQKYAVAMPDVHEGYGFPIESRGMLEGADAGAVSGSAKHRGGDQLGTIGSGNHFVEVDVVHEVFDEQEARRFGIEKNQIVLQIHTGSRGLGHQVATDSIRVMMKAMPQYGIHVADRELACAPLHSPEGRAYLAAMAAAANFAFANRQFITAALRRAWKHELGENEHLSILYDVAHNVAKIEEYDGRSLVVHRKGATRAFPGQPVLIPGSMGTASYLLVGRQKALEETFGSSCHGAGRVMSRMQAKKQIDGRELKSRLEKMGIIAEAGSTKGLVEEAPEAYKDVEAVVNVVADAGIAAKVARLKPLAVIKG